MGLGLIQVCSNSLGPLTVHSTSFVATVNFSHPFVFSLTGLSGYPLSHPSIYRGSARQGGDSGPLALPCPGVTGHVFAIALPADQLTLKVPSVFLSRPWVKQPTVHPTRCKLLSRYALSCYALMYLQTPASTEKHTHCRSPFTTSSSLSAAAMVYPHLRQLILPWSTKSSPSTHRLATAPVLIVTSAILPPIRTPSMTIPITLPCLFLNSFDLHRDDVHSSDDQLGQGCGAFRSRPPRRSPCAECRSS